MTEARSRWWLNGDEVLVEEAPRQLAVLRIKNPDPECYHALGQAFGLSWPADPNMTAMTAQYNTYVYWLSPETWLLSGIAASSVVERVRDACGSRLHHISDVSDGRVAYSINGRGARDLLATACSLDLHPRSFARGRCAQTLLAQIPVLITLSAHTDDSFEIIADVSFTGYFRAWFDEAARHYES